ncbi:MAG: HAMP domain-containing sensor histidine kinase [Candidatus Dojkabacteria bacterium]|nr:MAG: HAMP domain-containing sensor histidine kinase [Candidatus Dojkabacteria bacterium]
MFKRLKYNLIIVFTVVVLFIQFITGFVLIMFEVYLADLTFDQYIHKLGFLLSEVSVTTIVILMVGYVFVQENFKPAEDMVARLNQFTQDASHELRTPLSNANIALDLALRSKKYEEYIREAKMSVRDANNIVDKLLALAKLDKMSLDRNKFMASESVMQVMDMFNEQIADKGIKADVKLDEKKELVGDSGLFKILVANLVDNAIKYNLQNGELKVKLTSKKLSVANTGKEINAVEMGKIFDRFYQTDESRSDKGYGIGLAVVKKIADLHKWEIQVESKDGLTTFILEF